MQKVRKLFTSTDCIILILFRREISMGFFRKFLKLISSKGRRKLQQFRELSLWLLPWFIATLARGKTLENVGVLLMSFAIIKLFTIRPRKHKHHERAGRNGKWKVSSGRRERKGKKLIKYLSENKFTAKCFEKRAQKIIKMLNPWFGLGRGMEESEERWIAMYIRITNDTSCRGWENERSGELWWLKALQSFNWRIKSYQSGLLSFHAFSSHFLVHHSSSFACDFGI